MAHPLLYEINTRCWLSALSRQHGRRITLGSVPDTEIASLIQSGFSHIWLMGVWTTGPRSRQTARDDADQRQIYSDALPNWTDEDVPGSPYAIADYHVPPALGGDEALEHFRDRLRQHDIRLILDFVPNHVGLDHPWLTEFPDRFVQGRDETPSVIPCQTRDGRRFFAHGRDPHFPPWTDTVQLDYRRRETREAMTVQLSRIAGRCDGVRCDMAMLLLNEVFAATWREFPCGDAPQSGEFWPEAIQSVKKAHPDFLFLAECYWDRESHLLAQGFDHVYDKPFYDLLLRMDGPGLQDRLAGMSPELLHRGARFLENHDELRIAPRLSPSEHQAAASLLLCLPGLRLLHEGQLTGARKRVPVQLARRLEEPVHDDIADLYSNLLSAIRHSSIGRGEARLLQPKTWPDNPSARNMIVVQWLSDRDAFDLVAVNLAAHRVQGIVPLREPAPANRRWTIRDRLGVESHERDGGELAREGLYLDLPPHASRIFQFQPI